MASKEKSLALAFRMMKTRNGRKSIWRKRALEQTSSRNLA